MHGLTRETRNTATTTADDSPRGVPRRRARPSADGIAFLRAVPPKQAPTALRTSRHFWNFSIHRVPASRPSWDFR